MHLFPLSSSFEDAVRLAVSYGGDSDTLGAIVGSLAGAHYEIPDVFVKKALSLLPQDLLEVVVRFGERFGR
ncbi:MAG: ADP-ribosylglycohydrolase family protein [Paludibacteraceae bacterium]|nr:ADP-ribosylglycohydrolase family protein [Paludibacteraceae bacterium]